MCLFLLFVDQHFYSSLTKYKHIHAKDKKCIGIVPFDKQSLKRGTSKVSFSSYSALSSQTVLSYDIWIKKEYFKIKLTTGMPNQCISKLLGGNGLEYIQATILASNQEWNKNFIQLRNLFVEQNKFICCHVWILKKDFSHLFVICYPLHVHLK